MSRTDPQIKVRVKPEVKAWLEKQSKTVERAQTWLVNHYLEQAMKNDRKQA